MTRSSGRRRLVAAATACLALHASACSFAAGSNQVVSIQASDPHARISVDGRYVGTGAASVDLSKKNTHAVLAEVDGRAGTAHVDRSISTTGILDLVGGFFLLVPWLGVLAPGFWTLEPTNVAVAIPPAD